MTKLASLMIAASLALTASAAASAADGDITLRVERGSIMTSQGGEFASAQSGKVLFEGERMMVTEGAAATVFYDEDCKREYSAPGVYVIERDCKRGAVVATGTNWRAAGMITGGVLVGAAILENMDKSPGQYPAAPVVPPAPLPVSR